MPLRLRLQARAETLQDFETAVEQKLYEGLELMASGHSGAGIYLMGYAAEMLLKGACHRFSGALLTDEPNNLWGPARARAQVYGSSPRHEGRHSLVFWFWLLREDRLARNHPLPTALEAQAQACVDRLYSNWWVEARYRPDQALASEAEEVLEDTSWLWENYLDLWR